MRMARAVLTSMAASEVPDGLAVTWWRVPEALAEIGDAERKIAEQEAEIAELKAKQTRAILAARKLEVILFPGEAIRDSDATD